MDWVKTNWVKLAGLAVFAGLLWYVVSFMAVAAQAADVCRIAFLDAVEELSTVRSTIDYQLEVIRSTPSLVHCPVDTATERAKYEEKRPSYED